MGPTASGKTALAIELYQSGGFDIISVDSAMVYRGLDIGSAKPSQEELVQAPHRLIDIRDPAEAYNAVDFRNDALREIERSHARNRIPLFVGGTMLYYKVLLEGVANMPSADAAVRAKVEAIAEEKGWQAVHALLTQVDPVAAERIHPNHSQRLSRAYEVFLQTGKPLSQWHSEQERDALCERYNVRQMAVMPIDRKILHGRIEQRFDQMMELGFEAEVMALMQREDLHLDLPSMRSVGYRQMWRYLAGEINFATMRDQILAATRQLAKRQFTWLRGWEDVYHLDVSGTPDLEALNNLALRYYQRD
ncbi:tRNA (adenosine(37)-N6)-dimethylallyltransferase MiaA [Umboniibacter marinipuniceus]|nr:tRNA (adenosine(37)-N6)-dimethylallyltransferase MiaA [Umboniibacter marinipuniceus]